MGRLMRLKCVQLQIVHYTVLDTEKKPIKPNLSDEAREMLRQSALKKFSKENAVKTDLESNDKEIGGEE